MEDLTLMIPTETLEVLTRVCSYPLILTKKSMEKLPSGTVLKIISDCAENAISGYCEKQGFEFQTVKLEDKSHWEFYIRKL